MARLDKRCSKDTLLAEISKLTAKVEAVYNQGEWGIGHVGLANYASRESEALGRLQAIFYEYEYTGGYE